MWFKTTSATLKFYKLDPVFNFLAFSPLITFSMKFGLK